jgi:hypothetical protein
MLAFPRLVLKSRPVSIFRNSGEIFDSAQGRPSAAPMVGARTSAAKAGSCRCLNRSAEALRHPRASAAAPKGLRCAAFPVRFWRLSASYRNIFNVQRGRSEAYERHTT